MNRSPALGAYAGNGPENPFLTRLRLLTRLDDDDLAAIGGLAGETRQVRARADLVREGDRIDRLHVLLDGWACRVRLLPDGRRQITSLLIPGDLCDLDALHLRISDFGVTTLTPCVVAPLNGAALRELAAARPPIGEALSWLGAVENAMLAERNACLGRRSAREHLAHLLCELLVRLTVVGQATVNGFTLPITQEEIGDVLGLTAVHVNRVLQGLRSEGLIEQQGRRLVIRDWTALRHAAAFRPDYLHLEGIDGEARDRAVMPWASTAAPQFNAVGIARG